MFGKWETIEIDNMVANDAFGNKNALRAAIWVQENTKSKKRRAYILIEGHSKKNTVNAIDASNYIKRKSS